MIRMTAALLATGLISAPFVGTDLQAATQRDSENAVSLDDVPSDIFAGSRENEILSVQVLLNVHASFPGSSMA